MGSFLAHSSQARPVPSQACHRSLRLCQLRKRNYISEVCLEDMRLATAQQNIHLEHSIVSKAVCVCSCGFSGWLAVL